ncbi:MAG: metallophosphoesterase, partial [Leptolyngbyaceae cyanobacterium SL_5_14]|nr:metallophosphoesterase [Leptolyngbyaceae cyanobacterium SL_5_14]
MRFVTDPPISTKIRKMKQRVRWRSPQIMQRGIDQTRMVFSEDWADEPDFSFLVIGDSGSSAHRRHNPQRQIAEQMTAHLADCRFTIHTGDVVYLVGSR